MKIKWQIMQTVNSFDYFSDMLIKLTFNVWMLASASNDSSYNTTPWLTSTAGSHVMLNKEWLPLHIIESLWTADGTTWTVLLFNLSVKYWDK